MLPAQTERYQQHDLLIWAVVVVKWYVSMLTFYSDNQNSEIKSHLRLQFSHSLKLFGKNKNQRRKAGIDQFFQQKNLLTVGFEKLEMALNGVH